MRDFLGLDSNSKGDNLQAFLALQPYGILLLDHKGKILKSWSFPRDPEKIAKIITDSSLLNEPLRKLLSDLRADELRVSDQILKDLLEEMGIRSVLSPMEEVFLRVRRHPHEYASQVWGGIEQKEYFRLLNEIGTEVSKIRIRKQFSSLDQQVIKAVDYIDHVNKALNILSPAIREWYSIHFPELNDLIEDHYTFMKVVSIQPDRRKISLDDLREAGLDEAKARKVIEAAADSIGAYLEEEDLITIKKVAERWISLYESRVMVESFIEDLMRRAAPNISAVVHPLVGARLIAVAGGLSRLASLPASSIQILGAYRAIFMHLVKGAKPPKHGILFQAKEVRTAPKRLRGKVARLLATKIAIAARVDAFGGGRYIGDVLRKGIDEKLKEILQ